MNINLDLYRIFYVIAKSGSISAAAETLFISQPAITFQIKKLEDQLGISLFTRTKHGVILTDEGKVLFDYVKNGIESITNGENALSNLKNLESGIIRIGASTTVCRHVVMPYLEIFHELYPKIDIQIVNNLTSNLLKDLRNGNLDILFLNMPMDENKDLKIIIKDILNKLTPREREIIKLRHGLDDLDEKTFEEIGKIFGITRQRANQIANDVYKRIRKGKNIEDYL